jgi:hypothetical protein
MALPDDAVLGNIREAFPKMATIKIQVTLSCIAYHRLVSRFPIHRAREAPIMAQNLRDTGTNAANQGTTGETSTTNTKGKSSIVEGVGTNITQDSTSLSPQGRPGYQTGNTNQSDGR